MNIRLDTGILDVAVNPTLNELVGFGSRINKKRGFLFVSKVLGKHIPTKPSSMKKIYSELAFKIKPHIIKDKPTLVIGFAETATALGNGVFDALRDECGVKDIIYIHSTRFQTSNEIFLSFYEEHCHAPSHIIYKPKDNRLEELLYDVDSVILVDDEVSTGNTANNLINEIKKLLPRVDNYIVATILNWTTKKYDNFSFISLYKGKFSFEWGNNDLTNTKSSIISEAKEKVNLDEIIPYNFGRYAIEKAHYSIETPIDLDDIRDKRVLVLGTAEFMYPPYLLALYLEENGVDVYNQATTRSPVNIDGEITSKIGFIDNYFENIDNFLYNVVDREYDKIYICYETTQKPAQFKLKEMLEKCGFDVEDIFFRDN